MELKVTWKGAARVWWSFFWRYLIAIILSTIPSTIAGLIFGTARDGLDTSAGAIINVTMLVWVSVPVLISIVPLKLILGKDFGGFRLVLVRSDTTGGAIGNTGAE